MVVFAAVTRTHLVTAAAIFVLALCVYVATMAPSVGFIDSGMLTVAAWSGGNAHPPGFPLYLMLTKLVTLVPAKSVAWRANLASALFAAGACSMVALAASEAVLQSSPPATTKSKKAAATARKKVLLAMTLAGTFLLFARTLWRYATIAEVYALNTFLVGAIVWLVVRWRRTRHARDLYLASALFGLALGVHHVTVGVMLLGLAAFMMSAGPRFLLSRQILVAAVLAVVALVAVYAYLPFAASRKATLNWGDPTNAKLIWQHVSGAQFRPFIKGSHASAQAGVVATLVTREFGPREFPIVGLLAIAGLIAMARRDRPLLMLTLLGIAGCCAWMIVYPIQNDRDAYLLPAFVLLAIAAAYGAASIGRSSPGLMAVFLVLPIISAVTHWPYRDRSNWWLPRQHVENALRPVRTNALLITSAEQLYTPLFYYQEVEKLRPDVRTVNWELLQRWWYVDTVERKYPDVFQPVRVELDAFRPSLIMLRDHIEQYSIPAVRQETNARQDDLVLAMIREQLRRGVNVYLTHELAFSRRDLDQSFVQRLAAEWRIVPLGIAVAILPRESPRPDANAPIDLRGLLSPSVRYEDDDVVPLELIPAYKHALLLRGRYLASTGDLQGATRDYRAAAELDR